MSEINLEKIDMVRERTGVSYEEAKQYLEANNGNVVEAIVAIERDQAKEREAYNVPLDRVVGKIKALLKEGNVTRIRIKHNDRTVLDLPVAVGVVAAVLAPVAAAIGAIAAVATRCTIEVERDTKDKQE